MIAKIGLIAGSGQFPLLFAKAAALKGLSVYAAAYLNEADPELQHHVSDMEWMYLGQVGRLIRFLKKHGVDQAVMLGAIRKTRLFTDVKPDLKAIRIAASLTAMHDDGILRSFAGALEKDGIRIRPSTLLLPELVAVPGCWTKRRPSRAEQADINLGWTIAKEIGRMDIGQCLIVGGGAVLAVEAAEGTDAAILRGGALGHGEAVVIKICKPNQDTRFDVPAVGSGTIRTMIQANAKALAIEAGKAVVFDREDMIKLADQAGIAIQSMT